MILVCRREFLLLVLLGVVALISAGVVAPERRGATPFTAVAPQEVTVPRQEIAVIIRELCGLEETDANATDLLREVAAAAIPRDMVIGLRFPAQEAVCDLESGELAAILDSLTDPSISAVVASLDPGLCALTPRLAALKHRPFITWSCPQQGKPSSDVISLLPSLSATAEALAKVSKRMRWRRVAVVTSETGWWSQFNQALGHSLRVRGIFARHLVVDSDQSDPLEHSRTISRLRSIVAHPYRAVIVCVSAAELKGILGALQKASALHSHRPLVQIHPPPALLLLRFRTPSLSPFPSADDVTNAVLNWTGEVKVLSHEDPPLASSDVDKRSSATFRNRSSADEDGFSNISLPDVDISSSVFEAVGAAVAFLHRRRFPPSTAPPPAPTTSTSSSSSLSTPLPSAFSKETLGSRGGIPPPSLSTAVTRTPPPPANSTTASRLPQSTSVEPPKTVSLLPGGVFPRFASSSSSLSTPSPKVHPTAPHLSNSSSRPSATLYQSFPPPIVFVGYRGQGVTIDGRTGSRSVLFVLYKAVNRKTRVAWKAVLRQDRPGGIFFVLSGVPYVPHPAGTPPPSSSKTEEDSEGENPAAGAAGGEEDGADGAEEGGDGGDGDYRIEYDEDGDGVTANGRLERREDGKGKACDERDGEECEDDDDIWKGPNLKAAHIAAIVLGSAVFVIASILAGAIARKQLLKKRMSKGPYKILLTPSDFVFPPVHDNRRHLQELGGAPEGLVPSERPEFGLLAGSLASLRPGPLSSTAGGKASSTIRGSTGSLRGLVVDTRARYNGDMVQLKELPVQSSFELKNKAMDVLLTLHGLRHENVNPLLGVLTEPPRRPLALVLEWCSRGSLEDVLVQDDIKLDWSFRLSLLTDLVRGMRYLHSCPIKVHGNLTSRNCVIDARWVLKVTDYGLPSFYAAQNLTPPSKTARELLWTAPELLRDESLRRRGSQPGDVYSFGIVMQEVVVRGEPFCMLSLTPEDIIEKVKRPPPLIRPSVSKGAAPPEAINIMRQCWAEAADMRPDFNAVHDLFKKLNHGRKVNFVDTMFQMLEKYSNNLEELIRERTEQLDIEKKKTEQLLNRMLPSSVAEKLKLGRHVDPEEFQEVTIYFSDIVGFTSISAHSTPFQVVDLLNDLYTCFDATINAFNVYKVETIGDAYMVVGGLPVRIPDHADQIATMALHLLHQSGRFRIRHLPLTPLRLRIGLHTGPCCAGVVGLTMPRYCLFGDTVNTASRMESTGAPWRIHLSEATKLKLDEVGGYRIEYRGETEVKGKGPMPTFWLLGKEGFDKALPTPPASPVTGLEKPVIPAPEEEIICTSVVHEEDADKIGKITTKQSSPPPVSSPLDASALGGAPFSKPRTTAMRGMDGDLSLPYNHYRCLPPGEGSSSYSNTSAASALLLLRSGNQAPGCRLLKRQFSLDRGDDSSTSSTGERGRLFKQNSAGAAAIASELERIEEVHSIGSSSPPTLPPPTPPPSHRLPLFAQHVHVPYSFLSAHQWTNNRLRDAPQSTSASATFAGSTSVESLLVMPGAKGHGKAACMERTQSTGSAPAATSNSNSSTIQHHGSTNLHESGDVKG